jgi:hypothetical protein
MLRVVDEYWMDHIDAMDDLKQDVNLRAYANEKPIDAYKRDGYDMFEEMVSGIRSETVRRLFTVHIRKEEGVQRKSVSKTTTASAGGDDTVKKQPVKRVPKPGRNDPCPCGKWKADGSRPLKYKECCGRNDRLSLSFSRHTSSCRLAVCTIQLRLRASSDKKILRSGVCVFSAILRLARLAVSRYSFASAASSARKKSCAQGPAIQHQAGLLIQRAGEAGSGAHSADGRQRAPQRSVLWAVMNGPCPDDRVPNALSWRGSKGERRSFRGKNGFPFELSTCLLKTVKTNLYT